MDDFLLLARLVLAGIFVVAGLTKLADLPGSRRAIREFGLPSDLAPIVGLLLPVAEILTAGALILSVSAWAGSIAAATILLLFLVTISFNLRRGNTPDCHCFGQFHSEPIGPSLLIRNAILFVIAAFIVIAGHGHPGTSATAWLGSVNRVDTVVIAIGVIILAVAAVQSTIMFNLLQQNGSLLLRIEALESGAMLNPGQYHGLPIGTVAPDFALPNLNNETVTLDDVKLHGKNILLVFASPGCVPCATLLPDIAAWQRLHGDHLTVAIMTTGSPQANELKMADFPPQCVLIQKRDEVAHLYRYRGTPGAVIVSAAGQIATPLVTGAEEIRALLQQYLQLSAQQSASTPILATTAAPSQVGQIAPAFDLATPSGKRVQSTDFRGHDFMLLFWDTGCGFCQAMQPELIAWMESRPTGTPDILPLSSGPVADDDLLVRMGLVLLDPNGTVAQTYGATGTPMGILVNADGFITSEIAVGASAVFQLAGRRSPSSDQPVVQGQMETRSKNGKHRR